MRIVEVRDIIPSVSWVYRPIGAGFEAIVSVTSSSLLSLMGGGAVYPRVPRGSGLALHCAGR